MHDARLCWCRGVVILPLPNCLPGGDSPLAAALRRRRVLYIGNTCAVAGMSHLNLSRLLRQSLPGTPSQKPLNSSAKAAEEAPYLVLWN